MPQVKIGPNFFSKARKDYRDWRMAFAREILQNSIDAKGTEDVIVDVTQNHDESVTVAVMNNGEPMTEEILVNKLLSLGESGKEFQGTVGGFGKAKELLYFCNASYQIHSGDLLVVGVGGDYDVTKATHFLHGTQSTICIKPEEGLADLLEQNFKVLIYMTQRPNIAFKVNGQEIPATLKKGSPRREFEWGTVYTNKSFERRLIVRIDGIPMFTRSIDVKRCVILELKGTSSNVLQASRDGLLYQYQAELDEFIREITLDKKSALSKQQPKYTHYAGRKLNAKVKEAEKVGIAAILTAAYTNVQQDAIDGDEPTEVLAVDEMPVVNEVRERVQVQEAGGFFCGDPGELIGNALMVTGAPGTPWQPTPVKRLPRIPGEFVIKNELGMAIPEYLLPEAFSSYAEKLVTYWASAMLELHILFERTDDFAIGFILSDSSEAEYEADGPYGPTFYINPCTVRLNAQGGRSLARRWNFTPEGKSAMLSTATHELAHRTCDSRYHDEEFASALTSLNAVVLNHRNRFHKCFRG